MTTEPRIIDASDSGLAIRSMSDISDAIGACYGADALILTESSLGEEFFDLRSGLAGELLQKLVNYRVRTAIVLPDPKAHGDRFAELAHEHATHGMIRFVRTVEDARAWLSSQ